MLFCNDKYLVSRQHPATFLKTIIKKGASVGANATILPGITIGQNALIGAGSVVIRDVAPNLIMAGNPAKNISNKKSNNYEIS